MVTVREFIKRSLTGILIVVVLSLIFFKFPVLFSILLFGLQAHVLYYEWPQLVPSSGLKAVLITIMYPVTPFVFLIALNASDLRYLLLLLFSLVFNFDTGSYFMGKLVGRHLIMPHISPKKTWEGVIGGILLSMLATHLLLVSWHVHLSFISLLLFCGIVSFIALCGDLFESWLKRRAGVKDSGFLLPGHGGVLDRFDGVLMVAYFFYPLRFYLAAWLGVL